MSYLRGLEYQNEKARHGKQENRANQYTKKKVERAQNEPSLLSDKTYEKLADKHSVSRETIKRDAKFAAGVNAIASVASVKVA